MQNNQNGTASTVEFERRLDARLIMSIVATGIMSFSGVCVETAMNVTFPTLMEEFSINTATVQWLTTAYLLVLAAVVPTSGYLNRRFKTKHVFCFAMVFYIAGILCGFTAQIFPMLLLGRVLEGIGTGVALPLMFNIITEQSPQKNLGFIMGVGSLVTATAPAVGPSVGGWLSENFGWRAIFAALLPILVIAFVLGVLSIRQSHELTKDPFDFPGWASIAVAFAALVFAVDMGATLGWTNPIIFALFAAFILFLALFIVRERRCEQPLIHLGIFKHAGYVLGLGTIAFMQFSVLALSFLLPNYAQLTGGAGQTEAGSVLLFGCIVGAAMAPCSGQLLDRFGARRPILAGAGFALASVIAFALISPSMSTLQAIVVYIFFALGQGLMAGNTMTACLRFLPAPIKADGNAMYTTIQQLMGAIGTSISAAIVNAAQVGVASSEMAAATATGTQNACFLLIVTMGVSFACAFLMTGKSCKRENAAA